MFSNQSRAPISNLCRALEAMPNLGVLRFTYGCFGFDYASDQSDAFDQSNAPFSITDLTAPDLYTRSLISLFKTQTSITSLTLTSLPTPIPSTTSLQNRIDPSFLPHLTYLEADIIPCIELVPGRPLTHVKVVQPTFAVTLSQEELEVLSSALVRTIARLVSVELFPQASISDYSAWLFAMYLGETSV
jgi:hypothetical protein